MQCAVSYPPFVHCWQKPGGQNQDSRALSGCPRQQNPPLRQGAYEIQVMSPSSCSSAPSSTCCPRARPAPLLTETLMDRFQEFREEFRERCYQRRIPTKECETEMRLWLGDAYEEEKRLWSKKKVDNNSDTNALEGTVQEICCHRWKRMLKAADKKIEDWIKEKLNGPDNSTIYRSCSTDTLWDTVQEICGCVEV